MAQLVVLDLNGNVVVDQAGNVVVVDGPAYYDVVVLDPAGNVVVDQTGTVVVVSVPGELLFCDYTPPAADVVDVDFGSETYTPPDAGAVDVEFCDVIQLPEPEPVVPPLGRQWALAWGSTDPVAAGRKLPWQHKTPVDRANAIAWRSIENAHGRHLTLPWEQQTPVDTRPQELKWDDAAPTDRAPWTLPWAQLTPVDRTPAALRWGTLTEKHARGWALPWTSPPPVERLWALGWSRTEALALVRTFAWLHAPPTDRAWRLPWGTNGVPYDVIESPPRPPWPPPVKPPAPPEQPAQDARRVTLAFLCPYSRRDRDPRRLILPFGNACPLTPGLGNLYMSSSSVVKLPERTPIPCAVVKVAADADSFPWTCQLTVLTESALALIIPTSPGSLVEVEITINGHVWVCVIEGYTRNQQGTTVTWTATGRSPSVQLARPYAQLTSWAQPASAMTAQQIALEQLEFTGWSLDWDIDDWTVPAGLYAYHQQTPIAVIGDIATAAGALVQTHRSTKTLRVLPRYPANAWEYDSATPDVVLPNAISYTESIQLEPRPAYNRVIVMGERAGGVIATCTRTGTAGDLTAPQNFVHALITDGNTVARAKAVEILSASGDKRPTTRTMVLTPAGQAPGLLEIGQLVELESGDRGVVTAVRVSANRQRSGAKAALRVEQQIDLELVV